MHPINCRVPFSIIPKLDKYFTTILSDIRGRQISVDQVSWLEKRRDSFSQSDLNRIEQNVGEWLKIPSRRIDSSQLNTNLIQLPDIRNIEQKDCGSLLYSFIDRIMRVISFLVGACFFQYFKSYVPILCIIYKTKIMKLFYTRLIKFLHETF